MIHDPGLPWQRFALPDLHQVQVQLSDHGVFGWKYTLTRSYEVKDAAIGIKSLEVTCPDGEVILRPSTNGELRCSPG